MASPLVETKLYPPKLRRRLVARPRLSGRLRRGAESRLMLISAPAGFGKTTLLAEWLAAADAERSVAWLSLEESDRQPASYWTYLITALQTVVPGVGTSALPLLQSASHRSRPSSPRCSMSSAPCRTTAGWCSTTTTSSTAPTSRPA